MTRHMTLKAFNFTNSHDTSEECSPASHGTEGGSGEAYSQCCCRPGSLDLDQKMCLLMQA